jgi:hypothetical protein
MVATFRNVIICSLDVLAILRWLILKERNGEMRSAAQVVKDRNGFSERRT